MSAGLTGDDGVPVRCDPEAFRSPKVLFRTATASGDCCTPALPWGDVPVMEFLERCDVASAGDFTIRYLNRQDLIRMRQASGRVKDLRRARELLALSLDQGQYASAGADRRGIPPAAGADGHNGAWSEGWREPWVN